MTQNHPSQSWVPHWALALPHHLPVPDPGWHCSAGSQEEHDWPTSQELHLTHTPSCPAHISTQSIRMFSKAEPSLTSGGSNGGAKAGGESSAPRVQSQGPLEKHVISFKEGLAWEAPGAGPGTC